MNALAEPFTDTKPETRIVDFGVSGMHCANCATQVERVLRDVPGVRAVSVNFALESVRVEAETAVRTSALAAATEGAGFPARFDREAEDGAHRALTREVILSALLTVPLVSQMLFPLFGWSYHLPGWAQFALALPVQAYIGRRFYLGAWASLKNRAANMDVLVVLGTTTAFLYSLYLTLAGAAAQGLYFEASAVIITLVLLGKLLETRAKDRATGAIQALMALTPMSARRVTDDGLEEIPISQVRVGDLLSIAPGETVPVDGVIVSGAADMDERHLTGESLPVHRGEGEAVSAGAGNLTGVLTVQATAVGQDTRLARITDLVRTAQSKKAPIQKLVDRISAVFVPAIVAIAILSFAGWILAGAGLEPAVLAAVSVLIIACPCALGLAAPAAVAAGLGAAARAGILVADLESVERAGTVRTVVFDKTGTLTKGEPRIAAVDWTDGREDPGALAAAVAVQSRNDHPLARAILTLDPGEDGAAAPVDDFALIPGKGVRATVNAQTVLLGSPAMMAASGIEIPATLDPHGAAGTPVYLAIDGTCRARFQIVDQIRDESAAAVAALKATGRRTVLLSGDAQAEVDRIAAALEIDEALGGIGPEDKAAAIQRLQQDSGPVAMVGDGINDAPALATADMGIAMGDGANVAIQTAGITLMRPDPGLTAAALQISKRTLAKIRQNLFWAFIYNVVGIPLAALGYLSPALAGTAMAMSSLCVVGNAVLLTAWRPRLKGQKI